MHGGGVRVRRGLTIMRRSATGLRAAALRQQRITDWPARSCRAAGTSAMLGSQQLRVIARFSDGRETGRDSGTLSIQRGRVGDGQSDGVGQHGFVSGRGCRHGELQPCRVYAPRRHSADRSHRQVARFAGSQFHRCPCLEEMRKLNVLPRSPGDDADYLRRVYLDMIGTLPTADEARQFLADKDSAAGAKLVDALLDRTAMRRLLGVEMGRFTPRGPSGRRHKRAYGYFTNGCVTVWRRTKRRLPKGEIVTAEGPLGEVGPASFYKVVTKPGEAASIAKRKCSSVFGSLVPSAITTRTTGGVKATSSGWWRSSSRWGYGMDRRARCFWRAAVLRQKHPRDRCDDLCSRAGDSRSRRRQ